jgi:acyl phosphate:glycerol-3-phosphate acyltransferase
MLTGLAIGLAIGSVPLAWLVHRLATGRDLRRGGSGNPGATNALRLDGPAWGMAMFALDAGKGALAVFVAARLAGAPAGVPAAWGVVVGHVFTPWLHGRGGKGVAVAAGAFAVVAPAATGVAFCVFVLVVAVTRFVSLGSTIGAVVLPIAMGLLGSQGPATIAAAATAVLIAWRHRGNFARMRAGTEPSLFRRSPGRRGGSR